MKLLKWLGFFRETCPKCKGEGMIFEPAFRSMSFIEGSVVKCEHCNEKGWV